MIRNVTASVLFSLTAVIAVAQENTLSNKFTLKINAPRGITGFVTLNYINGANKLVTDTAYVQQDVFLFKSNLSRHQRATLKGYFGQGNKEAESFPLFLEEGNIEIILPQSDFKGAIVTGSKLHTDKQIQDAIKENDDNQGEAAYQEMNALRSSKTDALDSAILKKQLDSLSARLAYFKKKVELLDYAFIEKHPDAEYSAFLMDFYFENRKLSLDSSVRFIDSFTQAVKENFYGLEIIRLVNERLASAVGQPAPTFAKVDINNKPIDLSQFKGKYVLLDFWASWCIPCREENPRLKKIYERYSKNNFEIISISWDFTPEPWKEAIKADGTGAWRHIFASPYEPNDGSMRERFSIASVPTLILIDNNGKIIGRYRGATDEGSMDDLESKLAGIFK